MGGVYPSALWVYTAGRLVNANHRGWQRKPIVGAQQGWNGEVFMTDARYPIVVLLLFLSCSSVVWADVAWTLVTLGDSLTEGAGDDVWTNEDVPLGYPGRLVERLQAAGVEVELHNLGVSGWTSTELIEGTAWDGTPGQLGRAEALVQTAMAAGRKAVALVWVGSNDLFALYEWKCGADSPASCAAADLGEFDANIATILGRLQAAGAVLYVAQLDDQSRRPVLAEALAEPTDRPTNVPQPDRKTNAKMATIRTARATT